RRSTGYRPSSFPSESTYQEYYEVTLKLLKQFVNIAKMLQMGAENLSRRDFLSRGIKVTAGSTVGYMGVDAGAAVVLPVLEQLSDWNQSALENRRFTVENKK